jgi:hypothetical protein
MAKLTTKHRNALPDSAFAGPGRSYPVFDKSHAANAKARAAQHASPELKAKIDAKADKVLRRAAGGDVAQNDPSAGGPKYGVDEFKGGGFQRLIDNSDSDEELSDVVKSARTHGLHVPSSLSDVEGYNRGGRVTQRGSETMAKLRARHGREV